MSFEKQNCENCERIAFCVDTLSLDLLRTPKEKWLCSLCFEWLVTKKQRGETVKQIMIQCGIEDLEKC